MPHLGEVESLTGTIRGDGTVQRYYNSLVTALTVPSYLLLESAFKIILESGTGDILLES